MISIEADGTVLFRVYLPHAAQVEVVGDFTDWRRRRVAMRREYPGWWSATVSVTPGDHAFGYLVDGSIHVADYGAHGVKLDSDGKWVSALTMRRPIVHEPSAAERAASERVVA